MEPVNCLQRTAAGSLQRPADSDWSPSYLPEGVEMTTRVWSIKEWWKPRMRPLPNYWV